jgi:3-hydroxyacyl-CoA dehydrogenase
MEKKIREVGVIGAGVMGSAIAAQLANVGIKTVLLDIVPTALSAEDKRKGLTEESVEFRNSLAAKGIQMAQKAKPASFYLAEYANRITIGNLSDDLERLRDVDWIIEAVVERIEIKKSVFQQLEPFINAETIITSNTSGISAAALCEERTETFRQNFAITHFFNPPRYMKLLEIVPGPETLPPVIERLSRVSEKILGKGVVLGKDTPNFIANRIGVFSMFLVVQAMQELDLSIEAVDQLTGPVVGHPKSASFRTVDLVGLDTLAHVANNVYEGAIDDERRDLFKIPDLINHMIDKGLLGEKVQQGFYKKSVDPQGKREILSLDYRSLAYTPQEEVNLPSLQTAKETSGVPAKIKTLYYADDKAGQFTFQTLTEMLIYTANRIPEIAEDIVTLDNAMKWGFAWELGPFETWDSIGLIPSVEKMKKAGYEIPRWIADMVSGGFEAFYKEEGGSRAYYHVSSKSYREIPISAGIILLPSLKNQKKEVAGNKGASLVDIGDGVACLEFHAKMNAMGDDIISMVLQSVEIVSRDFEGLIIANHGTNFSAGANLPLILFTAQEEEWDELDWMIRTFQNAFLRLKYLDKPVVAAPAGLALGGGCEICLASDRVRYAAETYMGLVEVGVGLIPAGGGTKELLIRNTEHLFDVVPGGVYPTQIELMPFVARAFETIALAKVATSGPEAIKLGYLRPTDKMTVNRDFLIDDAKKTVFAMTTEGYEPPEPPGNIRVAGENSLAMFKLAAWTLKEQGYATAYDLTVAEKVAYVLCGGRVQANTRVSEQYLLDLEREAFLSLCGNQQTQARIAHMLKTGKPLRN